ncbi:M4 family metallopeptidase [Pseudoalteromonas piscicida]|uniref:M4 family metallopeptidase n=1 Tax=Pseudoalteromonas piscicida TaxID=43662 RepID=UPI000E35ED94|nr:M4 family metallopeptidase [Pseudoalteromonas piscicida]AXR00418.1 zinc metalloprotease [Pseudoalteromonas piscicida]
MKRLTPITLAMAASFTTSAFAQQSVSLNNNEMLSTALIEQLNNDNSLFRTAQTDTGLAFETHSVAAGGKHQRRSQYYKGLRVYGGEIVTHHDTSQTTFGWLQPAHKIVDISGRVITGLTLTEVTPSLDEASALSIAKSHTSKSTEPREQDIELIVYPHGSAVKLAYLVTLLIEDRHGSTRPEYIIDGHTGDILSHHDTINHSTALMTGPGGNEKIGRVEYGVDRPAIKVAALANGQCRMEDDKIKVIDMQHGTTNTSAYEFRCGENNHKFINGAYAPLNDALYLGRMTQEMFANWYGIQAVLPHQLVMRIHYGENFANATWNGREVTFGDGNHVVHPLVSTNVTAHEVAHGFTSYNSKLVYLSQSGGVNEAFSDMAGEALECYLNQRPDGTCTVDWQLGKDILKGNHGAFRYFDKPSRNGRSIDHADQYKPGLDVHYSSGVFNRAFYLLSNSPGWDVRKAFEVMVEANRFYWVYNDDFDALGCGVTKAATSLGYNTQAIGEAFAQVGVYACLDNKTPTIELMSPTDQSQHVLGSEIVLSANAQDEFGEVDSVTFEINDQVIGTVTQSPWQVTWNATQAGNYTFTATVTDNEGATAKTAPRQFSVVNPADCRTLAWQANDVYVKGDKVAFSGFEYTAQWWNRGQNPSESGAWGVWKKGVACGGTFDDSKNRGNYSPTIDFIKPTGSLSVEVGEAVPIQLVAADKDGKVDKVVVKVNNRLLTELHSTPFTFNYVPKLSGSHVISAVAIDDKGAKSERVSKHIQVTDPATEPKSGCKTELWKASSVYQKGERVSHEGFLFEAKWWTRNQNPAQYSSQWAVWKKLQKCN